MSTEQQSPNHPPLVESPTPQWSTWTRQFVTIVLVIIGVFALIVLAPVSRVLITTFLLVFLLYVPARFVARRTSLNFTGSVIILYVFIIGISTIFVLNLIPSTTRTVNSIIRDFNTRSTQALEWLRDYEPGSGAAVIEIIGIRIDLDSLVEPLNQMLVSGSVETGENPLSGVDLGQILSSASGVVGGVLGTLGDVFSTGFLSLFLAFLILVELPKYQNQLMQSIPNSYKRESFILGDKIMKVWNGFFRGQLTLGIIIGIITWLQLVLMGVPNPVGLSVIVALISLIPTIGGIIALVPLGLVPLLQGSTVFTEMQHGTFALLVVGVNLIISQLIWNGVAPKIMGDAVSLPLPVIIVGIIIGTALGGVLGAFLIVPILGSLRVVLLYIISKVNQQEPFPGEQAPEITDLSRL